MHVLYTCIHRCCAFLICIVYFVNIINDYGLRISLAKEVERQMSIVTQLPNVAAQSRAFISGRSKVHGMLIYIYAQIGGRGWREKKHGREYRWLCGGVLTKHAFSPLFPPPYLCM